MADREILIQIADSDGVEHDRFILAPVGMPGESAVKLADLLIREVKRDNPKEFSYEDLDARLIEHRFRQVEVFTTNEDF